MTVRLTPAQEAFLCHARVARMATVDTEGMPHVVPICPVLDRDKIYVATPKASRKVRNLRASPKVAFAFDDYVEEWNGLRGLLIQGRAKLIARGERFRELRNLFYAKFPQYPEVAPIGEGDVIVEVRIDHLVGEV